MRLFRRGELQVKVSEANVDSGVQFDRFGGALLESKPALVSVPGNPFAENLGHKFFITVRSLIRLELWPGRMQ